MISAELPANERARLQRLKQLCLLDSAAEKVLDDYTRMAASVTGMPIALISLLDVDRQWFKSAVGLPQGSQTPREWAFCAHAIADEASDVFEVTDSSTDPRFHDNPLVTGAPYVQHYAGVPLTMPGGEKIGTICVIDDKPGQLPQAHLDFLSMLADSIVNVLLLREEDLNHRRKLELTLAAADAGCWEFLPQSGTFKPSPAFLARFCPALRGTEMPIGLLACMSPPETVQAFAEAVQEALHSEDGRIRLVHDAWHPETGAVMWLRTQGRVVERDEDGRPVRMLGVTKDITESHEQRLALARERDRADQATRAKSDFVASLSHEIRTPIHGVLGLARMLGEREMPEQEAGWVRSISQCGDTLLQLVDDVLDFSKIEAGKMTLQVGDVDLRGLLDEMRAMFSVRVHEKGLTFRASLEPDVPVVVRGDSLRLRQILINLLGNAVKFTRHGAISLDVHRAGERLVFEVSDSGIGIAAHEQGAVFQRYVQAGGGPAAAAGLATPKSTGLGLAIVQELARLMGGQVLLTSVLGQGSIFTVDLPLEASLVSTLDALIKPQRLSGLRVLAVDDDEINRIVVEGMLRTLGVEEITVACDGCSALDRCKDVDFDVVLMDCQMPDLDGAEVTRHLRDRGWRGLILALSAGSTSEEREACLRAGMDAYLSKPIALDKLALALSATSSISDGRYALG